MYTYRNRIKERPDKRGNIPNVSFDISVCHFKTKSQKTPTASQFFFNTSVIQHGIQLTE